MSFDEKMATLIRRIPKCIDHLETEEATKTALVMPFIAALGYDVFNPREVIPEYVADLGTKRGEKVDYAIMRDNQIVMLIECKKSGAGLDDVNMSQLFRYFSVTQARIGVLTNGLSYRFFSDLEEPNKMDCKPFLELDLLDPRPSALKEVKKLAKEDFDLDEMLSAASELKYTSAVKKILASQFENPEEEFVRFFFTRSNPGARFVVSAKESFTPIVTKAFQQYISEKVNDRLRSALQNEDSGEPAGQSEKKASAVDTEDPKGGIVTTEEELEGFHIVRAILRKEVEPQRVSYRDRKTYMAIILDNNGRKPICRLHFNTKQKYLGVFDREKNETRISINDLSDIYSHAEILIETANHYDQDMHG